MTETATDTESRLAAWHAARYGSVNKSATYRKLLEEVGELGEALMAQVASRDDISEEAADVAILLTHLVRGFGNGSLQEAMAIKTTVIESRPGLAKTTA